VCCVVCVCARVAVCVCCACVAACGPGDGLRREPRSRTLGEEPDQVGPRAAPPETEFKKTWPSPRAQI
jgi:hypothetical protein